MIPMKITFQRAFHFNDRIGQIFDNKIYWYIFSNDVTKNIYCYRINMYLIVFIVITWNNETPALFKRVRVDILWTYTFVWRLYIF